MRWSFLAHKPPPPSPSQQPLAPGPDYAPYRDAQVSIRIPEGNINPGQSPVPKPEGQDNDASLPPPPGLFQRFKTQFEKELYITGEHVWRALSTAPTGQHSPLFTVSLSAVLVAVFCLMVGQYDTFHVARAPASLSCLQSLDDIGPSVLLRWLFPARHSWCTPKRGAFDAQFLIRWGSRWGPAMGRQPHRWVASALAHITAVHLGSNLLMIILLGGLMEVYHGWYIVAPGWLVGVLGGNLLGAAAESPCTAVVGASGGFYGLVGMFMAEMVLSWKSLKRKILRCLMLMLFAITFGISTGLNPEGTSHLSHVGGALYGVLAAAAWMPKRLPSAWRTAVTILGIAGLVSHKVFGSHWSGRIVYIVGGFLLRDKAPILPRSLTTAANEEPRRAQPPDEVIGGLRPLPPRKRSSSEEDGGA